MAPQAPKKAKLNNAVSKRKEEPVEEESDFSASGSEFSASDSDAGELSEGEDLDEVDEFDDASDSENEDGDESGDGSEENDDEAESEEEKKPRKDKFEDAMSAILGSRVKAHDQENPILIRNKRPAKEIEDAKEEGKARKALRAERVHKKDKARLRNIIPKDPEEAGDMLANEKRLKKIAQRGVVRLMNAINAAQNAAIAELQGEQQPQQPGADMSKEKFLDMLRMG